MFQRIIRVFKSWIGYFISFAEDPEVMLQESIEEMRNTLPKLNQILVTTRATVIRLEQEKEELERKEKQLVSSIKAALNEGSPEARRLAERAGAADKENAALQAEIDDLLRQKRDRMEQNRRALDAERQRFETWQARKRIEEQRLFEAVAPFVEKNPVSR